jgi:hypothetical protein
MLALVENQQHPIVTETINQARQRVGGVGLEAKCGGNRARHPMLLPSR